jgi:hypothetical protein
LPQRSSVCRATRTSYSACKRLFVAADTPEANEVVVGIMAILAQAERKMPQGRGQKLGGFRGYIPTAEGGTNGRKARRGKALNHAASLVRRTLRGSIRTARCRSEHLRRS